jgi:hypothetical protein
VFAQLQLASPSQYLWASMSGNYKAVCYKCSYVGDPGGATRCPICQFPFILEAGKADLAPQLERIFDRSSVRVGAPPLPGVDAGPRKAVLLMAARQRRIQRQRRITTQQMKIAEYKRRSRIAYASVSLGAVVFGALAAFLVSGGL